jgi:hypothetical protein
MGLIAHCTSSSLLCPSLAVMLVSMIRFRDLGGGGFRGLKILEIIAVSRLQVVCLHRSLGESIQSFARSESVA